MRNDFQVQTYIRIKLCGESGTETLVQGEKQCENFDPEEDMSLVFKHGRSWLSNCVDIPVDVLKRII